MLGSSNLVKTKLYNKSFYFLSLGALRTVSMATRPDKSTVLNIILRINFFPQFFSSTKRKMNFSYKCYHKFLT